MNGIDDPVHAANSESGFAEALHSKML